MVTSNVNPAIFKMSRWRVCMTWRATPAPWFTCWPQARFCHPHPVNLALTIVCWARSSHADTGYVWATRHWQQIDLSETILGLNSSEATGYIAQVLSLRSPLVFICLYSNLSGLLRNSRLGSNCLLGRDLVTIFQFRTWARISDAWPINLWPLVLRTVNLCVVRTSTITFLDQNWYLFTILAFWYVWMSLLVV